MMGTGHIIIPYHHSFTSRLSQMATDMTTLHTLKKELRALMKQRLSQVSRDSINKQCP